MTSTKPTDADLVAAVAGGNLSALGDLVHRHQDRVLALAYRFLGCRHRAADAAQDVFLKIAHAAPRYTPDAAFTTWLYRIVVNRCLDEVRRRGRTPLPMSTVAADPPDDVGADPLEAAETVEQVRAAIAALPDRQRTAVLLHRYEDLSHREIAEVTGWTPSAVESLLVRAYANLRKALAPLVDGEAAAGNPPGQR